MTTKKKLAISVTIVIAIGLAMYIYVSLITPYLATQALRKSMRDVTRKSTLYKINDILFGLFADYGLANIGLCGDGVGYEQMMRVLQERGLISSIMRDPAYPEKKYRYGCSEDYYRLDTSLDRSNDTDAKNDGGVDPALYEVGSALGANTVKVKKIKE